MIQLPKNNETVAAASTDPKIILLMSFPKVGKSRLALGLKNSLLVDFEDSTKLYSGTKVVVSDIVRSEGCSKLRAIKMIADSLKQDPRQYIVLDTITEIQDTAREYATMLYKQTLQGKGFTGKDVVSELAQGSGYQWLRNAMDEILGWFEGTYTKSLILLGHVKLASITKDGKDIQVKDLDIVGKTKQLICKDADAIGIIYRGKEKGTNYVTFKSSENDIVTGARSPHLSNAEFVISEQDDNGNLKTYWEKIFKDYDSK